MNYKMLAHSLAIALIGISSFAIGVKSATDARPMPRLIAQGCQGAGGDLWAMEESDFPTNCQNIERY